MLTDIWTVIWKEWKELFFRRVRSREDAWGLLLVIGFFTVFPLLGQGRAWLASPLVLIFAGWIPFSLTGNVIADSFAGERERHTLETLLATRLSDRAILVGKIASAAGYGWGLTVIMLFLQMVAINVAVTGNGISMYSPMIGLGSLVLSLLGALLPAGIGVFFSLRAPTVRSVQQMLGSTAFLLLLIPLAGARALPAAGVNLASFDPTLTLLSVIAGLAVLDAVLLLAAMRRFERTRLVLD
ncbi:MAG: ABC transporter permease [Chloroflexi bacterium]|nr:ABC transporter permease [Chloroflexota bacterium]